MSQPVAHRSRWSMSKFLVTESKLWPASSRSCHPAPAQRSLPNQSLPSSATLSPSPPPPRAHPPLTVRYEHLLYHHLAEGVVHPGGEGGRPDDQQAQLLPSQRPPPDSRIKQMITKIEEEEREEESSVKSAKLHKFKFKHKEAEKTIAKIKIKKKVQEDEEDQVRNEEERVHHHQPINYTHLHVPGPKAGPVLVSGTVDGASGTITARGSTASSSCSSARPSGVILISVGKKRGKGGLQGVPGGEYSTIASLYDEEPCQTVCRTANRPDCTATGCNRGREDDRSSGTTRTCLGLDRDYSGNS